MQIFQENGRYAWDVVCKEENNLKEEIIELNIFSLVIGALKYLSGMFSSELLSPKWAVFFFWVLEGVTGSDSHTTLRMRVISTHIYGSIVPVQGNWIGLEGRKKFYGKHKYTQMLFCLGFLSYHISPYRQWLEIALWLVAILDFLIPFSIFVLHLLRTSC